MAKKKPPLPAPPPPPRYAEWLAFFFGRADRDAPDKWAMDWHFEAPPADVADLFVHTMDNSGRDLHHFSDGQIAVGLESLLFSDHSNIPHIVTGDGVSEPQRVAVLRSLKHLYAGCLTQRSPKVLGHLSEHTENRLWYVTYMLWDVTIYDAVALKTSERTDALFEVFDTGLRSPNIACVESVLHGLGHVGNKAGTRAQVMIDQWLATAPKVRPELLTYARAARTGMIQ